MEQLDKKHIWIFGDSWSVPNYTRPRPGYRAHLHISELLANDGHVIENFGGDGADNHRSVCNAENFRDHHHEYVAPDLIIWFVTSIDRDIHWLRDHNAADYAINFDNIKGTVAKAAKTLYNRLSALLDSVGNPKLVVVEGQAAVVQPYFDQIIKPDLFIPNWRGEIVGDPDLPNNIWVSVYSTVEQATDYTTEEKLKVFDELMEIANAMGSSPHFVDNIHPGDQPMINLHKRITDWMIDESI